MRYVAPWDALSDPCQLELLDVWMAAARDAGARVLLGFSHSLRSQRRAPAVSPGSSGTCAPLRASGVCTTTATRTASAPAARARCSPSPGRGKVWFTETGGLVLRREFRGKRVTGEFGYGLRHAARATLHALALARLSRRIERVYLYHWQAPLTVTNWGSAFIGPHGRARAAYHALVRKLARMRR